jgi:hypothetical protein
MDITGAIMEHYLITIVVLVGSIIVSYLLKELWRSWVGCHHPLSRLYVYGMHERETSKEHEDYWVYTYRLQCGGCRERVEIKFSESKYDNAGMIERMKERGEI